MARRRTRRTMINQKLIVDTIGASLIVQKAPALINQFFPLDPYISKIAGVGAGWLTGTLMKRPDISNVSLALGIVDLLTPLFDNLIGGTQMLPAELVTGTANQSNLEKVSHSVSDYVNLNDYTSAPGKRQGVTQYRSSYGDY